MQREILRRDAACQPAVDRDAHRLRTHDPKRLRRQRVFGLGRADTPGQGAERPLRTGVAVGTDEGKTRQHEPKLRPDDVHDPLAWIADIE